MINRRRFLSSCLAMSTGTLLTPPFVRRALADTRPEPNSSRTYAFIGDGGFSVEDDGHLRESLRQSRITDLILGGDNRYDPRYTLEETWDEWRKEGFRFQIVTIGNHTPGYTEEVAYFKMPAEYYSYRDGDTLFLVLNSDNRETGAEQGAWLRAQLEVAQAQFIILIYHHPSFNASTFHRWQERAEFQNAVRPVIRDHASKITAIINGHEHISGMYEANGIPLIIAGSSIDTRGEPINATGDLDGVQFKTTWLYNRNPTWLRLDIDPEAGTVWINFVDMKQNKVTCSAELAHHPVRPVPHEPSLAMNQRPIVIP